MVKPINLVVISLTIVTILSGAIMPALSQTISPRSAPAPITTTWNLCSGIDSSGKYLPSGSTDLHWQTYLYDSYTGNTSYVGPAYVLSSGNTGGSSWVYDTKSQWISTADSAYPNPTGGYAQVVYRTMVDLTGYNLDTVKLGGFWSADDWGAEIHLNGRVVNNAGNSWTYTTPFSINSGFVQGLNTVDFLVYQSDNFLDGVLIHANLVATTGITPAPTLTSFAPVYAPAGRNDMVLSIHGTSFMYGCAVNWNGTPLSTTYVSQTLVKINVPGSLLAHTGTANITVVNPDGTTSVPATYSVIGEQPVITWYAPASAPASRKAFTLSIHGNHFTNGCYATWNDTPLATTYCYDTLIKVFVPADLVATAGSPQIVIHNPADDGGDSDPSTYTVTP